MYATLGPRDASPEDCVLILPIGQQSARFRATIFQTLQRRNHEYNEGTGSRNTSLISGLVHSLGVAEEYRIMDESDQYPKIDLYEIQHNEKSGNTLKPIIAGIMNIGIGLFLLVVLCNTIIYILTSTNLSEGYFIYIIFAVIGIIFEVISILSGYYMIKRKRHRFALFGTILGLIGPFGLGANLLLFIPFLLIIMSDDEFTS